MKMETVGNGNVRVSYANGSGNGNGNGRRRVVNYTNGISLFDYCSDSLVLLFNRVWVQVISVLVLAVWATENSRTKTNSLYALAIDYLVKNPTWAAFIKDRCDQVLGIILIVTGVMHSQVSRNSIVTGFIVSAGLSGLIILVQPFHLISYLVVSVFLYLFMDYLRPQSKLKLILTAIGALIVVHLLGFTSDVPHNVQKIPWFNKQQRVKVN